jgi:hypothetical protein
MIFIKKPSNLIIQAKKSSKKATCVNQTAHITDYSLVLELLWV